MEGRASGRGDAARREGSRTDDHAGRRDGREYRERRREEPERRHERTRSRSPPAERFGKKRARREEGKAPPQDMIWGKPLEEKQVDSKGRPVSQLLPGQVKEKASFALSGALNKDDKSGKVLNGVVLKWSEPPDAATPMGPGWRLYVFKGSEQLETLHIHRQSAFLFGRDAEVADVLIEHPSCSKQHAVIQFRLKTIRGDPGSLQAPAHVIRPYIMDLESTNGTFLNNTRLESSRYVELLEKDLIRFGESTREYVVIKS